METPSDTAQPPPWNGDGGDSDPEPGNTKPTTFGMRKSCERCRRKKRKCTGGHPCNRCLRNREECTFSKRWWHQPQAQQQRKEQHQEQEQQRPPSCGTPPTHVLQHSASGAVLGHSGMLPFKRCRLSASPATGLVGMLENSFLSDFFGCVGFLPLATQSHIRETMVKIMLSPAYRRQQHHQQPVSGDGCADEVKEPDAVAVSAGFRDALGGMEIHIGPSACIFWCAIALGALVRGSPIESVSGYTHLATEALADGYFGLADAGILKAWTILAHLYGFMGDEAKFKEYLTLADNHLSASVESVPTDVLPVGFAEMIENKDKGKSSRISMQKFCSRDIARPQLRGGASEHELYRYVMQSFQAFEHAIYSETLKRQSAAVHEPSGGGGLEDEGAGDQSHRSGALQPHAISEAMASVWIQGNVVQFGPLRDAADIPSIRGGIGGMLINGYLGFEAAGRGDANGTLERFGRCVEVFVRYPGLCRSIMGVHEVHMMLAGLAALDGDGAREVYDTLRAAYNPFRPRGTSPAPPLEEWRGMSPICDNLYCRAIEGVISSDKMRAFSPRAGGRDASEVGGYEGDGSRAAVVNDQSGPLASSVAPEMTTGSVLTPCLPRGCSERSGCGGSEQQCLGGSTPPQTVRVAAAPPPFSNRCPSGIEVDEEHGASSGVHGLCVDDLGLGTEPAAHTEKALAMPEGLIEHPVEDMGDHNVSSADWLDVTLAMLDEDSEFGEA